MLRLLMGASLLGGAGSLVAVALGAAGEEVMPPGYAALLLGSGVATLTGLLVLQLSVQQKVGRRDIKQVFLLGAPAWLRRLSVGLSLTGLVLVLGLSVTAYEPVKGGVSYLMAGAFGLFLFPAAFVSFFSYAERRAELSRRCSRGHELPLGAKFCPECSEDVRGSSRLRLGR